MKQTLWLAFPTLIALVVSGVAAPVAAQAPCEFPIAHVTAEVSDRPDLGDWKYCAEVTWDTGTQYGMSHLNLVLPACASYCDGGENLPFEVAEIAGTSSGESDEGQCELEYYGEILCRDPSIGLEGPMVKFEPNEEEGCEPGPSGTGTFCFYSDEAPIGVEETTEEERVYIKYAGEDCYGLLTGVVPACGRPVPTEESTWGRLKQVYR